MPNLTWADDLKTNDEGRKSIPEGLWIRCPACASILFRRSVENNLWVCPECQHHFRVSAEQRIEQLVDPGSFEPMNATMASVDPLGFVDLKPYTKRIEDAQRKTRQSDGVQTGRAFIKGRKVVLACMDFTFLGGSMGSVIGEKITRAIEAAADHDLPLVVISASGGARMMEGAISLMQMAKTSAKLTQLSDKKIPYISLCTDPTTGGTTASFSMLGDIIIYKFAH